MSSDVSFVKSPMKFLKRANNCHCHRSPHEKLLFKQRFFGLFLFVASWRRRQRHDWELKSYEIMIMRRKLLKFFNSFKVKFMTLVSRVARIMRNCELTISTTSHEEEENFSTSPRNCREHEIYVQHIHNFWE